MRVRGSVGMYDNKHGKLDKHAGTVGLPWATHDADHLAYGSPSPLRYRAEVRRREPMAGPNLHLYDGGDCSPYCIESLIDLLRSETRATRQALEMTFEILDTCTPPSLQEVASRFAHAAIPGLRVTLRAQGLDPVLLDSLQPPSTDATTRPRRDPPS